MTPTHELSNAALTYASHGWRVFPCEPRGKRPALIGGQRIRWTEQATDDLETVRAWWQAMPDANVGLVTGWPEGPGVVIDIDKPELMTAVDWPETLTAKTGSGGFHLYYQPRETLSNKTGNLPKGIDVRGCGTGYVIAPPSIHSSGQPYEWLETSASDRLDTSTYDDWWAALMPKWLTDCVQGRGPWPGKQAEAQALSFRVDEVQPRLPLAIEERASRWLAKAEPAIQGSKGQTTLFEVASHLGGFGLSLGEVQDILWREYNPRCVPPWAPNERGQFERHVREGYTKGPIRFGSKNHARTSHAWPGVEEHMDGHNPSEKTSRGDLDLLLQGPPHKGLICDEPPDFPVEALPPWLADMVVAVTKHAAVRQELVGALAIGLAGFAAAYAPKGATPQASWGPMQHPLNLWVLAIEESGTNKSGVLRLLQAPLNDLNDELIEQRSAEIAEKRAAIGRVEAQISAQQSLIKKAFQAGSKWSGDPVEELQTALAGAQNERRELGEVSEVTMFTSDATPEGLVHLVSTNHAVCLVSSEGNEVFDQATGRYGKGANMDNMLKMWTHDTVRVTRATKAPITAEGPNLSMVLATQPVTLDTMNKRDGNPAERGLVGRFLFAFPRSIMGYRKPPSTGVEIPPHVAAGYRAGIRKLYDVRSSDGAVMRFSDAALEPADEAFRVAENERKPGGSLFHFASTSSKLDAYLLRIAGLLHLADGGAPNGTISAEVVQRALRLTTFFREHGIKAWNRIRRGHETPAKRVWAVLTSAARDIPPDRVAFANSQNATEAGGFANLRTRFRGMTFRELNERVKGAKSLFPNTDVLRETLVQMSSSRYLAVVKDSRSGSGRRSEWVVMNPRVAEDGRFHGDHDASADDGAQGG